MPYVFRGFIIHLLNPRLGLIEEGVMDSYTEFKQLIEAIAIMLGAHKESEVYLERYLIQLS